MRLSVVSGLPIYASLCAVRYAPALPQIGTFLDASAFQAPVSNALAAPQFSISPLSTRFR
ncbi:hypothetical protein PDE01_17140 [Paracoccus denitrificans]|nr:hypothetical protein PDE01_17140 [Paracoccus denitrificans]